MYAAHRVLPGVRVQATAQRPEVRVTVSSPLSLSVPLTPTFHQGRGALHAPGDPAPVPEAWALSGCVILHFLFQNFSTSSPLSAREATAVGVPSDSHVGPAGGKRTWEVQRQEQDQRLQVSAMAHSS